jgi:flagellar protein FliO/FliZ
MMAVETTNAGVLAAAKAATPTLPGTPVVGGGDVASLLISMLIVIAVILVLGWLYSRSRLIGGGSAEAIRIVASRALGTKERLLVVEVADQQLLVGMTANGVQTLHVLDKPVEIDAPVAENSGFASRLRNALQEIGK